MKPTGANERWVGEMLMVYMGDGPESRRNGTDRTQTAYESFTLFANGDLVLGDKAWADGDPISCSLHGLEISRDAGSRQTRIVSPMGEYLLGYQNWTLFGRVREASWFRHVRREIPSVPTKTERSAFLSFLLFPFEAFVWILLTICQHLDQK